MSMMIVLLALAAAVAAPASACVYLMGEAKDSIAPHPMPTHWNYGLRGDDWDGMDASNKSWTCQSGSRQSPINLATGSCATGPSSVKTTWHYEPLQSNGTNIAVFNNGHTIQVQWTAPLKSDVTAYAATKITDVLDSSNPNLKPVKLTALQFHFHTTSEHMVDGMYAPIEMHIVHSVPQSVLPGCPASGCLSVVGIMFHVSHNLEDGPDALDLILDTASEQEGVMEYLDDGASLNIEELMPPADQRSYMQYEGSLTTPPCTEGLLWHVLKTPVQISLAQYNTYAKAVGLKECSALNATRRRMQEDAHTHAHSHHHHEGHDDHVHHYNGLLNEVASFQRGAYSGFVKGDELRSAQAAVKSSLNNKQRRSRNRKLQDDATSGADEAPGDWVCDVVSYGWTNRNPQEANDRPVIIYN